MKGNGEGPPGDNNKDKDTETKKENEQNKENVIDITKLLPKKEESYEGTDFGSTTKRLKRYIEDGKKNFKQYKEKITGDILLNSINTVELLYKENKESDVFESYTEMLTALHIARRSAQHIFKEETKYVELYNDLELLRLLIWQRAIENTTVDALSYLHYKNSKTDDKKYLLRQKILVNKLIGDNMFEEHRYGPYIRETLFNIANLITARLKEEW